MKYKQWAVFIILIGTVITIIPFIILISEALGDYNGSILCGLINELNVPQ